MRQMIQCASMVKELGSSEIYWKNEINVERFLETSYHWIVVNIAKQRRI